MTIKPYVNGVNFILPSNAAAEDETRSPGCNTTMSLRISIVPLLIFVAMFSVWKKDVCDGSIPVGPAGTTTSTGAMAPTRAGAGTTNC